MKPAMGIRITPDVFQKYPGFQLGMLLATGMDNSRKLPQALHLLREAEKLVRLTFNKETLRNHYLISPWKAAQEEFKGKAAHYHTIVEKLLKKVLAGNALSPRDTASALAQYLALKHLLPISADDAARLQGDVVFSVAKAGKSGLTAGDLYYRDSRKLIGAGLDYWQNPKVLPTRKSASVLFYISALPPVTRNKVREVMLEMEWLLHTFCGGHVRSVRLHWRKTSVEWR